MYYNRLPYPFVTQDGEHSIFTNIADDMVLWTTPDTALPIYVTARVIGDELHVDFMSEDGTTTFEATEGSDVIVSGEGVLSGYIEWDDDGVTMLKSTILGGDPQPWSIVTVDMSVCRPYIHPPFSVVKADNKRLDGCIIQISADDSINDTLESHGDITSVRLDLRGDYILDDVYASKIIFNNEGILGMVEVDAVNTDVLIKSSDTSDLRVITNNGIILTEVSNDKLQ